MIKISNKLLEEN